jgi:F-type H+-transporting ATPase subunit b
LPDEVIMRRIVAFLPALLVLACLGCAGEKHDKPVSKYKVTVHEGGKEVEKSFDLADAAQKEELQKAVASGHVLEMKEEEELTAAKIFSIERWDLGIWTIVVFVLVCVGLTRFAWKPMLQGFIDREEKIRSAQDLAEQTRKEANELHSKLQAQLQAGGAQVREMIEEARREATALKDQMVAEARSEIQHERDRLHREMDTAKDQALKEIWDQSVGLACLLATKAIRRQLTIDDQRRLLDETLTELREKRVNQ